jgi:hypothetical protein
MGETASPKGIGVMLANWTWENPSRPGQPAPPRVIRAFGRHHANRVDRRSTRRKLHGELGVRWKPLIGQTSVNSLACTTLIREIGILARFPRYSPQSLVAELLRRSFSIVFLPLRVPAHGFGRARGCFHFLEFFFASRNRVARAWSVWPTIRAGLACGIVKLKLDLAGSRKRPRLVFGQSQLSSLTYFTLTCVF